MISSHSGLYSVIDLPPGDEAAWHAWRAGGIGASEVGAILGASPYSTALDVYYRKTGEAPPVAETMAMRIGRKMEPVIAELYQEETGREIIRTQACLESTPHPFLRATLDGLTSDLRPVEFKHVGDRSADQWGESGSDDFPEYYAAQVQAQLIVSGAPAADLAALIGSDFRIYTIHADPELQGWIVDRVREFKSRVDRRDPPPITARDYALISRIRPTTEATIALGEHVAGLASEYEELGRRISADTDRRSLLKALVVEAMNGHSAAALPDGRRIVRNIVDRPEHRVKAVSYTTFAIKTPKGA